MPEFHGPMLPETRATALIDKLNGGIDRGVAGSGTVNVGRSWIASVPRVGQALVRG